MAKINEIANEPGINLEMLNEIEGDGVKSVFSDYIKVKVYNQKKGNISDKDNGTLVLTSGSDKTNVDKIKFNLICIREQLNGFVGDEQGSSAVYPRFTTKDTLIPFSFMGKKIIKSKQDLKEMLRSPEINGKKNIFHKKEKNIEGEEYDTSHIKTSYIVYGVISEGDLAGSFVSIFINMSGFGNKANGNIPAEGTLTHCLDQSLSIINDYRMKANLSQISSIKEEALILELSAKNMGTYNVPYFKFDNLVKEIDTQSMEQIRKDISEGNISKYGQDVQELRYAQLEEGEVNNILE